MGFSTINVELTNRCNKNCWMCGRRERENLYGDVYNKDMDFDLVKLIAKQIPFTSIVHLHNNGEGLLYPRFGDAARLFHRQIVNIVSNGKLLVEKANEIIGNSLKDNDAYLRYLWIKGLHDGSSEVIYIPTEANLPILEATRITKG